MSGDCRYHFRQSTSPWEPPIWGNNKRSLSFPSSSRRGPHLLTAMESFFERRSEFIHVIGVAPEPTSPQDIRHTPSKKISQRTICSGIQSCANRLQRGRFGCGLFLTIYSPTIGIRSCRLLPIAEPSSRSLRSFNTANTHRPQVVWSLFSFERRSTRARGRLKWWTRRPGRRLARPSPFSNSS
jgi:hypothetical protein